MLGLAPHGALADERTAGGGGGNDAGNWSFGRGFGPNGPFGNGIFATYGTGYSDYSNPYARGTSAFNDFAQGQADIARLIRERPQ